MSFSTFLMVSMAVAIIGGVLIVIALVMGRSRDTAAARTTRPLPNTSTGPSVEFAAPVAASGAPPARPTAAAELSPAVGFLAPARAGDDAAPLSPSTDLLAPAPAGDDGEPATEPVELAEPIPESIDPIEDLTPEVVLDLDPDIQSPRPISQVPNASMPASFGPTPFDDADTQLKPRVARGTTSPPPIPLDARRKARRATSVPPPIPRDARKPTVNS